MYSLRKHNAIYIIYTDALCDREIFNMNMNILIFHFTLYAFVTASVSARMVFIPLGSRSEGAPPPANIIDMIESLMGGMPGGERFGLHAPSNHFERSKSGHLIAIIPLPRTDPSKLVHSSISASIRNDGQTLHVRATLGNHMRSEARIALQIPAEAVVSTAFDAHGNARVLMQPKKDADLSSLKLESDEDAEFSLANNTSEHQLSGSSNGANGAYVGHSNFALWQAGICGAFAAVLCLVIIQWKRNQRILLLEKGPGEGPDNNKNNSIQLTNVLSQRSASGNQDDDVLFDASRKKTGEQPKKKIDAKLS